MDGIGNTRSVDVVMKLVISEERGRGATTELVPFLRE